MNPHKHCPSRGLYLLTPDEMDTATLVQRVQPLLGSQVVMLQLRNKLASPALLREQALALQMLCRQRGVALVINDDWRLAREIAADGVHLGSEDGDLAMVRGALGPSAIIGASCYGDLGRAARARDAGASYVAFGAFFPSATKPSAPRVPLSLLARARGIGLPTVAIGGVSPDNAQQLLDAGADLLAVLGSVFDAADPLASLDLFQQSFGSPHEK